VNFKKNVETVFKPTSPANLRSIHEFFAALDDIYRILDRVPWKNPQTGKDE